MECVAHLHSTACTGLPALSVQPRTGIVVYRGEQNVYRGEQKAYHVDEPPPKRLQRQQAAATPVATEWAAGLRRTKSSLNRAPTEKVKDESDAVSLEAAPFACGVHAHSDYSVNLLAYAVNSYGLQSESQE